MALSYKARRRWALIILVLGLPIYIMLAVALMVSITTYIARPPLILELLIYIALGIVWAIPLKFVFMGIGQADPDADQQTPED